MKRRFVSVGFLAISTSAFAMPQGGPGGHMPAFAFHRAQVANFVTQTAVSSPTNYNKTFILVLNNSGVVNISNSTTVTQTSNAINIANTGIQGYGGGY